MILEKKTQNITFQVYTYGYCSQSGRNLKRSQKSKTCFTLIMFHYSFGCNKLNSRTCRCSFINSS